MHVTGTAAVAAPLSLAELELHLAKAADLLRGSIDQADFKGYIFPLMFFKRISDVYGEEHLAALAESGGDHEFASFAENHRFVIPEGCLWDDVRERTANVGEALVVAFRGIEKGTRTRSTASSATCRGRTRRSCRTRDCAI